MTKIKVQEEPFVSISTTPLQDGFDLSQHYDLEYILRLFLKLLGDKNSKFYKALEKQCGQQLVSVGILSEGNDLTLKTNCSLVPGDG